MDASCWWIASSCVCRGKTSSPIFEQCSGRSWLPGSAHGMKQLGQQLVVAVGCPETGVRCYETVGKHFVPGVRRYETAAKHSVPGFRCDGAAEKHSAPGAPGVRRCEAVAKHLESGVRRCRSDRAPATRCDEVPGWIALLARLHAVEQALSSEP